MEQLLCHIFGDYILQSDWMAMNKSKRVLPCLIHVLLYTACFLFITTSWKALLVIGATHFILDHWPVIIKRLIWFKNHLGPHFVFVPWSKCDTTGYFDNVGYDVQSKPYNTHCTTKGVTYSARLSYLTIWLYIITDNFIHLTINYLALKYLG